MAMSGSSASGRAGRPISPDTTAAILAAARSLVVAHGFAAVTTAMIAAEAGASKQALYRRWTTKADLVLEAFLAQAQAEVDDPAAAEAGDDRLLAFLRRTCAALSTSGPALRSLMAAAQEDDAFRRRFHERLILPRRAALRAVLAEERPAASTEALDLAVTALFGAIWYRLLLDEPLDDDLARRLTALVRAGM